MLLARTSKYHPVRYSYVWLTVAKEFLQGNLDFLFIMLSDNSYLMECTELTLFQTNNFGSTLE